MKKRIDLPIKVFTDRQKVIAALQECIMNSRKENIIVVRGNIGVGKTRVIQEVLREVAWRDIIWGECSYLADYIAYHVVRELIKAQLQKQGRDVLKGIRSSHKRIIGKLIPEVIDETTAPVEDATVLEDKFTFYEGIKQIVDKGTRAKVIVVDNSQWIDQSSTNLLRYLIKAEKRQCTTFVFIYRTDEETEVLKNFLDAVRKTHTVTDIEIKPFAIEDVNTILASIIGEEPDEQFMRYVYRWSGGNPYYIEEITSTLVLEGHLVPEHGHWHFQEPKTGSIPKTVADIATAKYMSISEQGQRVLDIASVIGWFDIQILQEILAIEPVNIVERIEEVDSVGMVRYSEERIEFSDEISRNAVYAQVNKKEDIQLLHRRVGDSIKQRSQANERAVIYELAYHYYHGRDREKGVRFCIRSGDTARENYAYREAVRYYTWALEMLAGTEKREKLEMIIDCLRKRIEVYGTMGEYEQAVTDIQEAISKIRQIHDAPAEMDMIYTMAHTLFHLSKPRDALKQADRVMALARENADQMRVARTLMLKANIHLHFSNYSRALDLYTEALTYFERVNDRKNMSVIYMNTGVLYRNMGKLDDSRQAHERALSLAQQLGDKQTIASCLIGIGNLYHITGDYDRALTSYEEAYQLHQDIGFKQGLAIACGSISNVFTTLGQYRKALQFLQDAIRMKREIEDRKNQAGDFANMASIYTRLGAYSKAINAFENALRIAREIEEGALEVYVLDHMGSVYYYLGNFAYADSLHKESYKLIRNKSLGIGEIYNSLVRGRLYLAQDKMAEAKRFIDNAYEAAKKLGSKTMLLDITLQLCEYFLQNEEFTLFAKYIEKFSEQTGESITRAYSAYRDLLIGRFHIQKKEYPTAEKVLQSALNTFEKLEEQYNIGQVYVYLGMLEKAKGNDDDNRAYLVTARGIFEAINARWWKQKIDKMLDSGVSSAE